MPVYGLGRLLRVAFRVFPVKRDEFRVHDVIKKMHYPESILYTRNMHRPTFMWVVLLRLRFRVKPGITFVFRVKPGKA